MWFLYSGDRHVHVCAAEEQPHSPNGRGGGGLPRYSQTVASANPCRQQHITTKAMLCFYFPFQEICVVAPATDPSWRGSRLSLWSVKSHKTDQFDAELAVLCLRCVKVKTNLTCKNHHFYPPGGRMLWGPGPGQRLLSG